MQTRNPKTTPSRIANKIYSRHNIVKSSRPSTKKYVIIVKKNYVIYIKQWSAFALVKLEWNEWRRRARRTLFYLFIWWMESILRVKWCIDVMCVESNTWRDTCSATYRSDFNKFQMFLIISSVMIITVKLLPFFELFIFIELVLINK